MTRAGLVLLIGLVVMGSRSDGQTPASPPGVLRGCNFMQTLPGLAIQYGNTSSATRASGTRPSGSIIKRPSISPLDRARGAKPGVCYSAVYLDGIVVYGGKEGETLFDIDQLQSAEISGIEYYASGAQMPPSSMARRQARAASW